MEAFAAAWQSFGEGKFGDAWGDLVTVEETCKLLARYVEDPPWGLDFLDRHTKRIMRLFPYKVFNSSEFVAKKRECSVCGKDPYKSECPHVPGELHMGEFVRCTVSDLDMLGVSLTDNPLDKRCVIHTVDSEPTINAASTAGVKALFDRALGPLHGFTIDETPRMVSPRKYHHEGLASKCRCGSGKRFGTCCWRRRTMAIPWRHIELDNPSGPGRLDLIAPAVWASTAATMLTDGSTSGNSAPSP